MGFIFSCHESHYYYTSYISLVCAPRVMVATYMRHSMHAQTTYTWGSPYSWGSLSIHTHTCTLHLPSQSTTGRNYRFQHSATQDYNRVTSYIDDNLMWSCNFKLPRSSRHLCHQSHMQLHTSNNSTHCTYYEVFIITYVHEVNWVCTYIHTYTVRTCVCTLHPNSL